VPGFGAWWRHAQDGLPLPLGGNVAHKRWRRRTGGPSRRSCRPASNSASITGPRPSRTRWPARGMGREKADQFVGMYVNHWTLDYGEKAGGGPAFSGLARERGLLPQAPELEFVA